MPTVVLAKSQERLEVFGCLLTTAKVLPDPGSLHHAHRRCGYDRTPAAWNRDSSDDRAGTRIVFKNKIELAERMLDWAFEAGVPAKWVVADSFYGRLHAFRKWLEERGRPYAVMVPKTAASTRPTDLRRRPRRNSLGCARSVGP